MQVSAQHYICHAHIQRNSDRSYLEFNQTLYNKPLCVCYHHPRPESWQGRDMLRPDA